MVCFTTSTRTTGSVCLKEGVFWRKSSDESIIPPAFHVYTRDHAPKELIGTFNVAKLCDGVVHENIEATLMLQARMSHSQWLSTYVKCQLSSTNTRYHVLTPTDFEQDSVSELLPCT
jgi:hypothetical protein